ncbi:MAG: hypothetical protein RMX68_027090 [Aulosira sp. ZfuVER01]|nr:hypothetical protein [Aulosira sp. DedVER01a]MDZ8053743.1 hypothetical protein [Aulosira sp. ZfuCHP01]
MTVTAIRPTYVVGGALSADFRLKLDYSNDPVQKILGDRTRKFSLRSRQKPMYDQIRNGG